MITSHSFGIIYYAVFNFVYNGVHKKYSYNGDNNFNNEIDSVLIFSGMKKWND